MDTVLVEVEVDLLKKGLPSFKIVGLGDKAIDEARERVKAAITNSGIEFPNYKVTVNLAPADLPKEGPAYDLPIALGIIAAHPEVPFDLAGLHPEVLGTSLVLGELSLDGRLRPTPGVLPLTLLAKEKGFKRVFLPAINANEAAIVPGIEVMPVKNLNSLIAHLRKLEAIEPKVSTALKDLPQENFDFDLTDIKGQEQAKRALEIAAAGGHNLAFLGPPGSGKTLLARALPSILPRMTLEEALEVTRIFSIIGQLNYERPLVNTRPFRAPHHTISRIGLIGGGSKIAPGEISLAHRGVLFLDEFPELPRHVLESLRQPMEDGVVQISRAAGSLIFPSQFMLVVASNPCPCGFYGSSKKKCSCTSYQILQYQKRVSGPIWDRIDLHVMVPEVEVDKLTKEDEAKTESSRTVQKRVQTAREQQLERFAKTSIACNAELTAKTIRHYCPLSEDSQQLLRQALVQHALSARAYHKIIKIARTIADLTGSEETKPSHVAEALQFRTKTST